MTMRPRSSKKPLFGAILGVIGLLVLLVGIKALQIKKMMSTPFTQPPTTVSSAQVKEEDWSPTLTAVGSISRRTRCGRFD